MRIDKALIEQGLCRSRSQAQEALKNGWVSYEQAGQWVQASRPSQTVTQDTPLRLEETQLNRYVSRGGLKLEAALKACSLNVEQLFALDIGQSTGGFTDCLLQAGATKVVGVDVGHAQLHPSLRKDPRVIALEGINARALPVTLHQHTPEQRGFDLAVMDLSFISQTLVWPSLAPLIREGGQVLSLVKPQFEAGREWIGRKGLVNSEDCYPIVEAKVDAVATELGFERSHWLDSPIKGGDGNREFLAIYQKTKA